MTKEQIYRVKEAIRKEIGKRHQGLPKGGWDGLMEKAAIAAIEAMRVPTAEMLAAAPDQNDGASSATIYEIMIDAALPR